MNERQRQMLTLADYKEHRIKPGLWLSEDNNGIIHYLDFRTHIPRAYRTDGKGGLVNDSSRLLAQVQAAVDGQSTLGGIE